MHIMVRSQNYFNTYALGRSSIGNIIPKNTSALKAVCQAYRDINIKDFISLVLEQKI